MRFHALTCAAPNPLVLGTADPGAQHQDISERDKHTPGGTGVDGNGHTPEDPTLFAFPSRKKV